MPYNETALIQEVLRDLSALDATAAVSAEDSAAVQVQIAPVVAELADERIVTIASTAAIPDNLFTNLVTIVAERCALRFGRAPNDKAVEAAKIALARIARLSRSTATPLVRGVLEQLQIWGADQAAVDAVAVAGQIETSLASLAARNVIYIADEDALTDMPAAAPAVKRYIAALLAPKMMGDVIGQAEAELKTISRIGKGTGRKLSVDPALLNRRRRC